VRDRLRRAVLAIALLATAVALVALLRPPGRAGASAPAAPTDFTPFFAAGDAAANIPLRRADDRVVIRWVARHSGTIESLHIRVKVSGSGYGAGSTGVLRATTHPVRPDGEPRTSVTLRRSAFVPGAAERGGSVSLRLHLPVRAGQELATVVRNVARDPASDYFSVNFLYSARGVLGANGRNERRADARDEYYGLDPRELVGWSRDGGSSWRLPGAPYGARNGRAFLPTYVQQYADGSADGQFYYWSAPIRGGVTMVYPDVPRAWTITRLAAFTNGSGAATVSLRVDGARRASTRLSGSGFLSAPIVPVTVSKGATVTVTTTAGEHGLALSQQFADRVWAELVGLGTRYRWYLEGEPQSAVPVYPLPRLRPS
jgi:hypothetical protein